VAAVRDHEGERLPAELEAGAEHLDHRAVLVLVDLIEEDHVRARARLAFFLGADDAEEGAPRRVA